MSQIPLKLSDEHQTAAEMSMVSGFGKETIQTVLREETGTDGTIGFNKIGFYEAFWLRAGPRAKMGQALSG